MYENEEQSDIIGKSCTLLTPYKGYTCLLYTSAVMLLTGKTFNFVAIVGTLGLIGMIIKNGIVLMDEITLQINLLRLFLLLLLCCVLRGRLPLPQRLRQVLGSLVGLALAVHRHLRAALVGRRDRCV